MGGKAVSHAFSLSAMTLLQGVSVEEATRLEKVMSGVLTHILPSASVHRHGHEAAAPCQS